MPQKKRRYDEHGDESLHGSFIIVSTFIGLGIVLIGLTSSIQYYGISRSDYLQGWETIGGLEYSKWLPTYGYNVTPNDTQIDNDAINHPFHLAEYHYNDPDYYYAFNVPYGSGHAVRVFVIRNNSGFDPGSNKWWERDEDFFLLTRLTNDWPYPNTRVATVPFNDLIEHAGEGGAVSDYNYSMAAVMLGKLNCTLFVNSASNLSERLYANDNYTLRIGTEFGTQLGRASMWTVLGQLLTMRLPQVHWAVQAVLAIPIWAGIGFMAVTIISRFIPFIGGG